MAYKIKVNKRFYIKLANTYEYIAGEWGFKVADEFYENVKAKLDLLQKQPSAGAPSKSRANIRSISQVSTTGYTTELKRVVLQS